jgi:hypothetical protein
MKKQLFLAFACLSAAIHSLAADYCTPDCCMDTFGFDSILTFDVGGGYRNDSLRWKVFPSTNPGREIEEKWKNLGLGVIEVNAQFLACEHFLLKGDFDYGWFSNNGSQRYIGIGGVAPEISLKAKPRGHLYNLSGGVGYQFNFDCYRVSFAPLVGYSYHQQLLKSRKYIDELNPLLPETLAHNDYKLRWSGPWVGFALAYQATCELQLYFDYSYHWTRFHATVKEHFLLGQQPANLRSNRAFGNEFIVGGIYTFCDYWFVGLKFNYKEFQGTKGKEHLDTIDLVSPLRKLHWCSSTVTLDIGYTF